MVIVSHDRGFLNRTTGVTMWMFRKRLWYYGGNYDTFVKVRGEQMRHRSAIVEQQERKKAQLTQFISRCVSIGPYIVHGTVTGPLQWRHASMANSATLFT